MATKIHKQSGLSGITTLLRKEALDPNIDLTKTEDKVLNNVTDGKDEIIDDDSDDESKQSDIDEIYKLAKDLDIKIDGMGPDNVSTATKSRKTLANKLDKLSDSSDDKTRSVSKRSKRSKKTYTQSIRKEEKQQVLDEDTDSTVSVPVNRYQSIKHIEYDHSPQDYNFTVKHGKKTMAMTEEQVKRDHIDGVLSNIRSETRNTFSTDIERTQDLKASKLEQIASIKIALSEEGIDTSMITIPSMSSSLDEVESVLNLLLMKNNRYRYSSLAEEVISAGAEVLESVFDGTRTVPVFNVSPDYTGYSSTVNVKLHRLRFETSQVVGDVVERHNISPVMRIGMELLPGFLLYPRLRAKTKSATGKSNLENKNSTKSYNSIRSKLEKDPNKDDWGSMENI